MFGRLNLAVVLGQGWDQMTRIVQASAASVGTDGSAAHGLRPVGFNCDDGNAHYVLDGAAPLMAPGAKQAGDQDAQ
jgi:hypothetical protein